MGTLPSDVSQAAPEPGSLVAFVRRHQLFSYFFLTFLISWLGWVPVALSLTGLGLLPFRFPGSTGANVGILIGGPGPVAAAFICTALVSGKPGIARLWRRMILWRVNWRWYAFAILINPLLMMLSIFVIVPGALGAFEPTMLPEVLGVFVALLFAEMFLSSLFEEPGWRGFALPRLQARYGPVGGSLILGFFWGLWHLPLFTIPGYDGAGSGVVGILLPWVGFTAVLTGATMIMTWLFNHTRESVFMAMVFHAAIDGFARQFLFPASYTPILNTGYILIGWPAMALVLLVVTRGKLGYNGSVSSQTSDQ